MTLWLSDLLLGFVVFATSTLTATLGVGGGMLLIGVMPWFLPIQSVVPMHSTVQLASNLSRAALHKKHIAWQLLKAYVLGACIGLIIFGVLFVHFPLQWLSPLIGIYILMSLWWKGFERLLKSLDSIFIIGAVQTGVGLFVGATGPLSTSALLKRFDNKDTIIATAATFLTFGSLLRIIFFTNTGFDFLAYFSLIIFISCSAILGSYVGSLLRKRIPTQKFFLILKVLLSLLALSMFVSVFAK